MLYLRFLAALSGGLFVALSGLASAAQVVTDLAGRQVSVPDAVNRVVLGESRYIPALAILEGEALADRLAGMLPDFELTDPAGYALYRDRFPALARVPRVGHTSADSFSLESVLAMGADLAIFSLEGHGPGARNRTLIGQLEKAGVAVVFIDFRQNPLENTPKSMALLGEVLGQQARAREFNDFYQRELARVTEQVARIPREQWPSVFLHSRLGREAGCCETMAAGMIGELVAAAGGRNVALELLPGVSGVVSLEHLLTEPPDIYIATAIGTPTYRVSDAEVPYVMLGAGVSETDARASLRRATDRPGLRSLQPVREGRAKALWHHFYNSPMNLVAVQALATWFHPGQWPDLNPGATLREFYERFQPVALDGVYWIDQQELPE